MSAPISVLHVMNEFQDGSITRIVDRIVKLSDPKIFHWGVGALKPGGKEDVTFKKMDTGVYYFYSTKNETDLEEILKSGLFQIVHTHTPRSILAVWNCLRHQNLKGVTHVATKHLLTRPRDRKFGLVYSVIDYLSLYLPETLVMVSRSMAVKVKELPAMSRRRVLAIPNGIPCEEYDKPDLRMAVRQKLGLKDEHVVVGFNGRISRVKRLDDLIYAFHQVHKLHPETRLVMAGDGEMRIALELLTRSLGIQEEVIWLGFYQDIPGLLAAVDIYAQTSSNEGLSLSILEAMSAGKPVISTRVDSAAEIIEDGLTGMLIPIGSISALENSLQILVEHPEERSRIGENARKAAYSRYNLDQMVHSYQQLYLEIASRKGTYESTIEHLNAYS